MTQASSLSAWVIATILPVTEGAQVRKIATECATQFSQSIKQMETRRIPHWDHHPRLPGPLGGATAAKSGPTQRPGGTDANVQLVSILMTVGRAPSLGISLNATGCARES
jgi:hypothetical protein